MRKTLYLTDQVNGTELSDRPNIKKISDTILFSVASFYNKPERAKGFRTGFNSNHRLAEDSGGFQFLMGKLPLEKCDPMKTVEIYKHIGVTREDLPIQLDLPPRYNLPKEERLSLIVKGAEFFHVMRSEINWTVPVVHGWTFDELTFSLELLENPEKLTSSVRTKNVMTKAISAGTYIGSQYDWVMSKLQKQTQVVAAPSSDGGQRYVIDHLNNKTETETIGVGAFQQSGRYVLDEAGVSKKVASPGCTAEQVVQKTPQKAVWERLSLVLNMFRDRELFMLGAASSHDQHMIFMGGAKYGDTSSWRIKAYLAEVYVPEYGSVGIGYKSKCRPKPHHLDSIEQCLKLDEHPLCGMSLKRFLDIGKMTMKQWRKTYDENRWEIKPFALRALHNAFVLKGIEEKIANDFACDPDRYHDYLEKKRFKGRPNLLRKLRFLWSRFKRPYVQTGIDVFLKGQV